MGSNLETDLETPVHDVTLSSFQISKYEITQVQFLNFLNDIGCDYSGTYDDPEYGLVPYIIPGETNSFSYNNGVYYLRGTYRINSAMCPATFVTWYGANAFCKWAGGRLPTEAEWEFAARGGNLSQGYIYSGSNTANEVSWNNENSGAVLHPVGTKAPNELGIYDMSGNAYEFCHDYLDWSFNYYEVSPVQDPQGPETGDGGCVRGGSCWYWSLEYATVSRRSNLAKDQSEWYYRFRMVKDM